MQKTYSPSKQVFYACIYFLFFLFLFYHSGLVEFYAFWVKINNIKLSYFYAGLTMLTLINIPFGDPKGRNGLGKILYILLLISLLIGIVAVLSFFINDKEHLRGSF